MTTPGGGARVAVVGGGLMGSQIAALCAARGHEVTLVEVDPDRLGRVPGHVSEIVTHIERDPSLAQAALLRITYTHDLTVAAKSADIIIEAAAESLEAKRKIFSDLARVAPPHAVLATNSSSLRASQVDDVTKRPGNVANLHFYQPIWEKTMVEIMAGSVRDEAVIQRLREFVETLQLLPIDVLQESTGFVVNRIWRAVKKECLEIVSQGVSCVEDVDRGWMLLNGVEIGPFARMDRIGLDVVLAIEETYFADTGLESDRPPELLVDMVAQGQLGMKTGKGFYDYPDPAYARPDFMRARRQPSAGGRAST